MKRNNDNIQSVTGSDLFQEELVQRWSGRRDAVRRSMSDGAFVSPRIVAAICRITEFVLIGLVGLVNLLRYPGTDKITNPWIYASLVLLVSFGTPLLMQTLRGYNMSTLLNPLRQMPRIVVGWTMIFGALAVFILLAKAGEQVSRIWFFTWAGSGLLFYVAGRFIISSVLRHFNKTGQFNRRAVLVGGGAAADNVIATLENSTDTGVNLVGIFDDRTDERSPDQSRGLAKLGNVHDLIDFVRSTRIETMIITLPVTAETRLMTILNQLWILPVDIRLSAQGQKLRYRPRAYSYIGNLALLDLFDRPLGEWGPVLKAIEDKVIACLALVFLSPLFAAVAVAVKWNSSGPILFKQKRYGFNNELIEVYKFRSMYTSAADQDARRLVTKGDPRVTSVGRFIRRTSLDELPQLINVLKGELSLVGPRPHATKASAAGDLYETVVDGYFARHRVKPGMTGWAQINGWRGETDTAEKIERRVEHDLYYIENWSLTFDLYILARTPFALLNTDHAY